MLEDYLKNSEENGTGEKERFRDRIRYYYSKLSGPLNFLYALFVVASVGYVTIYDEKKEDKR